MKSISNIHLKDFDIDGADGFKARLGRKIREAFGTYQNLNLALQQLDATEKSYEKAPDHLSAIKAWCSSSRQTMPPIKILYDLCQLIRDKGVDCDIDYLCGNYDESNHTIKFIREETGLTEKTIKILRDAEPIPKKKNALFETPPVKKLGYTVSWLLEDHENGLPLLQSIADYLFAEKADESQFIVQIQSDLISLKGSTKIKELRAIIDDLTQENARLKMEISQSTQKQKYSTNKRTNRLK
ncbi:MAG: hypothetical protein IJR00_01370 [Lachnospiraceae bacterium]|nr:hypothetical protein [Lachnospiraceae bacterium]